ncbi:MAG: filamentation induced by cAMP protein Fic [Pedosphaera sp.]|nr:filamentation induced by cAMP protein Fic [Pedosphaera sp.]
MRDRFELRNLHDCNTLLKINIGIIIGNKMKPKQLFNQISDMEPLLPEKGTELQDLALTLIRKSERLRSLLHPITRQAVAGLIRSMNSYYSNLIEGHRTTPLDMDAALAQDFSKNAGQRNLQLLHRAHLEVQELMAERLSSMAPGDICSAEFLCWLHQNFYERLPAELRTVESERGRLHHVIPGKLREGVATVGQHVAPDSKKLNGFLGRFRDFYGPLVQTDPRSIVAAAAAHHRLVWIHPFVDGNGRVARLFTDAWICKAGIESNGLWTLSRGFARGIGQYKDALAAADAKRWNDLDGRGNLSDRALAEFCEYFLKTAIDQVEFMQNLLSLDGMQARIVGFAQRQEDSKMLMRQAHRVLQEIFLRGEIARGEVPRLTGVSARTGQKLTGELLARRLVVSPSPKGALRLNFPAEAAEYYFPNLYPAVTS